MFHTAGQQVPASITHIPAESAACILSVRVPLGLVELLMLTGWGSALWEIAAALLGRKKINFPMN